MTSKILKVDTRDNIIVALEDIKKGASIAIENNVIAIQEDIPIKHKFAQKPFNVDDPIIMYGVLVGKATQFIQAGARIGTHNIKHSTNQYSSREAQPDWQAPDYSGFAGKTFQGYHRKDGKVGTMNYWLVIPLVFCENRNLKVIESAMLEQLGYATDRHFSVDTQKLIQLYQQGSDTETILQASILQDAQTIQRNRVFPNVDGIKFLYHEGGCGGTRQDAETLCRLLAAYVTHANVAGATVLSLGCQNAQIKLFQDALNRLNPNFSKPLYFLEQQQSNSERAFIADAVKQTFVGLIEANKVHRKAAPLSKLTIGLECGGSDGFSGITANPSLGYTSDLVVALGGQTILSEFPELNGVEQELINRCIDQDTASKFAGLMKSYSEQAIRVGSGFDANPSPGNIKDGLITDAIKSAGAAKKGGTSPVVEVLDYTEVAQKPGLHLLCTPGNDVESTTGLAASGANIIVFTTGLGTPTGNPIAPTIKMATNDKLAQQMDDIIDFNAGTIVSGNDSIQSKGTELLEYIIQVASGAATPNAVRLGQDDFIPWKRGVSL